MGDNDLWDKEYLSLDRSIRRIHAVHIDIPGLSPEELEAFAKEWRAREAQAVREGWSSLVARLDKKTRTRVLCGRLDCGAQLGKFETVVGEDGEAAQYFQFPAGWGEREDRGYWHLGKYAAGRIRIASSTKFRATPSVKARRYPNADGAKLNDVMDSYWESLPLRALCPNGHGNLLEPDALGVTVATRIPAEPEKTAQGS